MRTSLAAALAIVLTFGCTDQPLTSPDALSVSPNFDNSVCVNPIVDGFLRDPVTGVPESGYALSSTVDSRGRFAGTRFDAQCATAVVIGFELSNSINDNSYGPNAIGWRRGHSLDDLLRVESMSVELFDCAGNRALQFQIDYAARDMQSGLMTFGDLGGNPTLAVIATGTSLGWNFHNASPVWPNRHTTSPQRIPTNSYDAGTTADPNSPWLYEAAYEFAVDLTAFGSSGYCGDVQLTLKNSPSKSKPGLIIPVTGTP